MKLYLRQKVFSWGASFAVKNEAGDDYCTVKGEVFTIGRRLHVFDTTGSEIAYIEQQAWSWRPTFNIQIDGRAVCRVIKDFKPFTPTYHLEGLPWRMEGNFLGHDYSLHAGDEQIMRLTKQWFTWGDSYELDIADADDALVCLCIALAVDAVLDRRRKAAAAAAR